MDKIEVLHKEYFNSSPEYICRVPGVSTLLGAFSDFCKGFCITSTGTLGLRLSLSKRDDDLIKLYNATKNDKKQFALSALKYRKEDKWANYIKGVISALNAEKIDITTGYNITLKGALLYCDDYTISVSIAVGFLLTLNECLSLKLEKSDIIKIAYNAICKYSLLNCRYRDILTLVYAENSKVLYFDLQNMNYQVSPFPFIKDDAFCLVVDPNVPPQILRQEIEEKRQAAHDCCKKLQQNMPKEYKLRTFPVMDLKNHTIGGLSEGERRTCEYVISETVATEKAFKAIENPDPLLFAKQLTNVYRSMRDVFEITCPEVDWLIKRAGETQGIYGASLINNGASGSIFVILDKQGEEAYMSVLEDYKRIFDFTACVRNFIPGGCVEVQKL